MKKLIDLKTSRANKIEEMQAIVARMEKEYDADKNTADQTKWDGINVEIEAMDKEIKTLERQEELNKTVVKNKPVARKSEEETVVEKYNLFKAINKLRNGMPLDGVEAEMHQEAEKEYKEAGSSLNGLGIPSMVMKANVTTSNQSTQITTNTDDELSIIKTPALVEKLGVKRYTGLQGKLVLPYETGMTAGFIAEGSGTFPTFAIGNQALTLAARSIGGIQSFTNEYLSQTSAGLQKDMVQDFLDSIWRGVQKDMFAEIGDLSVTVNKALTGMSFNDYTTLEGTVEASDNAAYVATRAVMAAAKSTLKGGADTMIWDKNEANGYNAFGTNLVGDAGHMYYGDFRYAVIGQWSDAISLLIDPYSNKSSSRVDILASGLFDTGVRNPYGFAIATYS